MKSKKTNFKELKEELIERLKPHGPCSGEYKKILNGEDEATLLKVLHDNASWCVGKGIITESFLVKFDPQILLDSGLANTGKENTGFANSGDRNSGDSNSGYRNSGYSNSGNWNSGNWNSGDRNSGNWNSGNWNSGYRNSGDRNSGNWNSGNWNSGNRNSGDRNSGYRNSGDRNSGDRNSGNWNSGDRNSGDSNSGYRNSGAFCTEANPKAILFNKESSMTVKEWEQTKACQLMYSIDPTVWIPWNAMTKSEQAANPKYEASEGYTKSIPLKEAWANAWGNWSDENKKAFTSLENFDARIFEEITGINI